MAYDDLNVFQVDCRIASQQRTMLLRMRRTPDEVAVDRILGRGDINRPINFALNELRYCQ